MMKNLILLGLMVCANALLAQTYTGLMDNFYPMEMSVKLDGESISGDYHYARVGKKLRLRGAAKANPDKTRAVLMEEVNEKNECTGKFEGVLSEKKFSGKWTKPDGSKSQPVELLSIDEVSTKAGLKASQREEMFTNVKKYHIVVPTQIPKGLALTTLRAETEYALTYSDGKPNGKQLTLSLATEGVSGRIPIDEEGAIEKNLPIKTALFGETKLEYSEVKGKAEDLFWGWYSLQRLMKPMPAALYSISAINLTPSDVQTVVESLALLRSPYLPSLPKLKFATTSKGMPDEAFIIFYENFREAILKKDKNTVASMTRFPFSSDVKSKKDLMKYYDDVFNDSLLEAINAITEVAAEPDGTMRMVHGDFVYTFVKENDRYKFASVGVNE
ncbi:MAG: hypothetical protein SNJ55_03040 [Chloroherpetonaceae bacterium]